jgi:hypothetical protein
MKITSGLKVHSLVLAAALSASLNFFSSASAQNHHYIVDLNSKQITDLGGSDIITNAINDVDRWQDGPM